jgi:hypothetical protein
MVLIKIMMMMVIHFLTKLLIIAYFCCFFESIDGEIYFELDFINKLFRIIDKVICLPILTAIGFLIYGIFIAISPFAMFFTIYMLFLYLKFIFCCCRNRNLKILNNN